MGSFRAASYSDVKRNVITRSLLDGSFVDASMLWANWASPEVLRGEHPSQASDVYSFGLVLYEMLTGRIPHEERSMAQLTGSVGHFKETLKVSDDSNKTLKQIVSNCLLWEAHKRPSFGDIVKMIEDEEK